MTKHDLHKVHAHDLGPGPQGEALADVRQNEQAVPDEAFILPATPYNASRTGFGAPISLGRSDEKEEKGFDKMVTSIFAGFFVVVILAVVTLASTRFVGHFETALSDVKLISTEEEETSGFASFRSRGPIFGSKNRR